MNTDQFQQSIGGTLAYMNIIMNATKGCGELSSNEALFFIYGLMLLKQFRRKEQRKYIIVVILI